MKKAVLELWQGTWDRMVRVTNKGQHLKKIKSNLGFWPWSCHRSRAVETVLAKLRIGHANFKEHSYRFNLSQSPLCRCGAVESIDHIFLFCPLYNSERNNLRLKNNNLNVPLTTKNLLGGGNFEESVQKMIVENVAYFLRKINKLHIL